jgi:hypothetical protein
MFSFYSLRPRTFSPRRFATRFALTCLLATLLFVSCNTETGNENLSIAGSWAYSSEYGTEKYIITSSRLEYGYNGDGFKGAIRDLTYFIPSAGVIIVEYDADNKPEYWDYSNHPAVTGPHQPLGNFLGVYFINLSDTSVKIANASDIAGVDEYYRCEAATLNEAKEKFTDDNVSNFIFDWSMVQTQVKQNQ